MSLSDELSGWLPASTSVTKVSVVPTSTSAQPAVFRPALEIDGQMTRFLVDQIRSIDVSYIHGDPIHYLDYHEMAEIEHAVTHYLGL